LDVSKASRSPVVAHRPSSPTEDALHQWPPPYLHGRVAQAVGRDVAKSSCASRERAWATSSAATHPPSSPCNTSPRAHGTRPRCQRAPLRPEMGLACERGGARLQPQPWEDVCEELPERAQAANRGSVHRGDAGAREGRACTSARWRSTGSGKKAIETTRVFPTLHGSFLPVLICE
jgi:hypothetical protein